jgi:nicotinate-nucleotide adenylyltransferase
MENKTKIKKIALFGGSFNPIHNQHINIIEKLAKSKIVDEVWIIPCKKHAFNKDFAPAKHRIKMINLAMKKMKNVKISRVELNFKGTTYTIKTIRALKSKYCLRFFWVIGSDILYEICKWNNYKELFGEIEFIVFKRGGYPIKEVKGMRIFKTIAYGANGISSTDVRNRTREGKTLKNLVPLSISKYIEKNKLYK